MPLLAGFADLLFAPVCLGCRALIPTEARERRICGACWTRLREIPRPRCERCGMPRPPATSLALAAHGCPTCDTLPPAVRSLRSFCVLEGPARRMVHALKYSGWYSLADLMAERMSRVDLGPEAEEEVRFVAPVPLSPVRLRQRGYNQAAHLAAGVARARGLVLRDDLLVRHRSSESQTTLHPAERRANVAGAFRAADAEASTAQGEHVLLVDDVWTTGATTLACAGALLNAGIRAVSVLTFARALPDLER